ncbi:MAG: class I SAM-dependent RNA methyltransferase [Saprospiraceae bacterium]|nr:class I SAM-dependent RNA methyltransferase [Saprospiraceae bacterium]
MNYIAKTFQGLEEILAKELTDLGAQNVQAGNRVVFFEGDQKVLYRSNLECYTALRILQPIREFSATTEEQLYEGIGEVRWSDHFREDQTFAIDSVCYSDYFQHSRYVTQKSKDAIVDQFREDFGIRPDVDVKNPWVRVHVHIQGTQVSVSLETSGESLHRRGYRLKGRMAPINEVLAAGMVLLSNWDGNTPLVDLTCGSGTICIEAAKIAQGIPSLSKTRTFGFQRFTDFDADLWDEIRTAAHKPKSDCPSIIGCDIDPQTIDAAKRNARNAQLPNNVKFVKRRFQDFVPTEGPGVIICNPPYDERLQHQDIFELYKELGDCFKKNFQGWTAWVISSNIKALKRVGLKASRRIPLFNGPLECRLYKFEMYAGSRRTKHQEDKTIS